MNFEYVKISPFRPFLPTSSSIFNHHTNLVPLPVFRAISVEGLPISPKLMPTHEIDDTDSSIEYFGIWTTDGATHLTVQAGAQLLVTFEGMFMFCKVLGLSVTYAR